MCVALLVMCAFDVCLVFFVFFFGGGGGGGAGVPVYLLRQSHLVFCFEGCLLWSSKDMIR